MVITDYLYSTELGLYFTYCSNPILKGNVLCDSFFCIVHIKPTKPFILYVYQQKSLQAYRHSLSYLKKKYNDSLTI